MTEGRNNFGMTFDPIRGLIVVGGITSIGSTRSTEIFDFQKLKFVKGPDLRHRLTGVEVFARNGNVVTVGGLLNGDPSKVSIDKTRLDKSKYKLKVVNKLARGENRWEVIRKLKVSRAKHTLIKVNLQF